MRFLVVFCHPSKTSFSAALYTRTRDTLQNSGHEVRSIELYQDKFDPVLSLDEWNTYLDYTDKNLSAVKDHVDKLIWAEGMVFVFPTWMYGPPALLKGWLERVWLPGVAFEIPTGKQKVAQGKLRNIKRFCVITTSGSPRWWLWLIGNPGKKMLFKGYKVLFNKYCKLKWLQLYNMNHATKRDRETFLENISEYFSKIP